MRIIQLSVINGKTVNVMGASKSFSNAKGVLLAEYRGDDESILAFAGDVQKPVTSAQYKEIFEPIELLNQFTSDELIAAIAGGGVVAAQVQVLAMNRKGRDMNIVDQSFIDAMNGLETAGILTKKRKDEIKKGIPVKKNAR